MLDKHADNSDRREQLDLLSAELNKKGVEYIQLQFVDMPGSLRVRFCPFKDSLPLHGSGMNTAILATPHSDGMPVNDYMFQTPICSMENGYPNILAIPDPATVVQLGWQPDTAAVLHNLQELDGTPCSLDLRARLAELESQALHMGYQTKFAVEYESVILHRDDALLRKKRYDKLIPFGNHFRSFDLLRHGDIEKLAQEFIRRMSSINIGISSFHTEGGEGMVEFALSPKPALEAADDAVRAKLYFRQLCQEHNLIASFMARYRPLGQECANGAHHHQSLIKEGSNAFYDAGTKRLSQTALHYTAGLVDTMHEFHLVFRPTLNSYRRFDRLEWSPEDASWGMENRSCAIRAVWTPAEEFTRLEHRVPGADVNPYLSIAAMLAGGLHGIKMKLDPGRPCTGDPVQTGLYKKLPSTLTESIETFNDSKIVRQTFGDELTDHYTLSRRAEQDAFETWLKSNITEFEFIRYFDS